MSDDVADLLIDAHARIDALEGRLERMFRFGKILDAADIDLSDPTNPVARIQHDVDEDGQPVKGPFVRYATWAGARNQHTPPSVGQQFVHVSPDGEMEGGWLIPLGHSTAVPSPSTDPAVYVDGAGATDRRFKDGKDRTAVGQDSEHLIVDGAQRIKVKDISQLIIRLGQTAYNLKMDALQPAQDIPDF